MNRFLTNFYSCKILKTLENNLVLVDVNLGFHTNIAACLRLNDEDYDSIYNVKRSANFVIDGITNYDETKTPCHIFNAKKIHEHDHKKDPIFYRCSMTRVYNPKNLILIVKLGFWVRKLVKVSLNGVSRDIEQCNLFNYDLKDKVLTDTLFVTFDPGNLNSYSQQNIECSIYTKSGECLNDWVSNYKQVRNYG